MKGRAAMKPYPGLRPFQSDEFHLFFGREAQTDELLAKLERHRFLVVVGPSGCGKSSLVRAGMIPALETGFMAEAGARWRVVQMRPGERPMVRLAEALARPGALGTRESVSPNAALLMEARLSRGPLGLIEAIQDATLPPHTNLLVLVDQFEEIFRFRKQGNRDEADAFVRLLLQSVALREHAIYVVLTMRSDFLGHCALFVGLPEAINDSQYLTPRLTRDQCRGAIEGPARVCGGTIDPDLTIRLLNDFGTDPEQLPVLQHALMRMWDRKVAQVTAVESERPKVMLTVKDYEAIGSLTDALTRHANEVMAKIPDDRHHLVEKLFRCLTERESGERDIRRPARLQEVAEVAGLDTVDSLVPVADCFRAPDCCFVAPPLDVQLSPETVLDISHEALIRRWDKLAGWVAKEAVDAAEYRRMLDEAKRWEKGEAELWTGRNLERGLDWLKAGLNAAWAARYSIAAAEANYEQAKEASEGEVALVKRFLSASEDARRAKQKIEQDERQRREQDEIDRQTRQERERRLEAEVKAGRAFKRWAAGLALAMLLAVGLAVLAWQQSRAAARSLEQAREWAEQAKAEQAMAIKQEMLAQERLERVMAGLSLKKAVLSGEQEQISQALSSPLANHQIRFLATRTDLKYKNPSGQEVYQFKVYPDEQSITGGLKDIAVITYRMDHPSFQSALLATGPDRRFTASYVGWGCLTKVIALIEYVDPEKFPAISAFDMCNAIGE